MSYKLTYGKDFCNETLKHDLFNSGFGGLFNYEDIIYAVRDDQSHQNMVWRFKLVITKDKHILNAHRFEIIRLESIPINQLFPGFE